jgi:hypothetical protein
MPFKETVNEKLHLGVLWNLRETVQKTRSEIEGKGGGETTANTAGFFTTTTFTALSAPGPEISLEKQNFFSPQPPSIYCRPFPVTEIKTNFKRTWIGISRES